MRWLAPSAAGIAHGGRNAIAGDCGVGDRAYKIN